MIIKRFIVASCEIRLVDRGVLHQAHPRIRNVDTTCSQRFSYDENAAIGKTPTGSDETSCNDDSDQAVSATTEGQKLIQVHIDLLIRNAEPNYLAQQMINAPTLKNQLLVLRSL